MRWPPPAKKGEVNYGFVDRFTFAHFAIGFAYGFLGFGFGATLALALAWEAVENPLKAYLPRLFPHGTADTLANIAGDTVAVLTGWGLHFVLTA